FARLRHPTVEAAAGDDDGLDERIRRQIEVEPEVLVLGPVGPGCVAVPTDDIRVLIEPLERPDRRAPGSGTWLWRSAEARDLGAGGGIVRCRAESWYVGHDGRGRRLRDVVEAQHGGRARRRTGGRRDPWIGAASLLGAGIRSGSRPAARRRVGRRRADDY